MGQRKKKYHYEPLQYSDINNDLLFYSGEAFYNDTQNIFLLFDRYDSLFGYSDLTTKIKEVKNTFKNIVNLACDFYDVSHKNPRGFNIKTRTEVIRVCILLGYADISERSKPGLNNIADIFNIKPGSLLGANNRFELTLNSNTEAYDNFNSLLKYIADHI